MCPVVLLALLFSFLLLLLEITAAINVTFNVTSIQIKEEDEASISFSLLDKSFAEPDEALYRMVSEDSSIASVINGSFKNDIPYNSTFRVINGSFENDIPYNSTFRIRGNFLGKTFIHMEKTINGTIIDKSQILPVIVQRKQSALASAFRYSVITLVSLNHINMGCALDLSIVKSVLKRPIAPAIGFVSQYAVMPLVSYCLARFMFTDVIFQLGLFTFGCSPGGGASNMWTVLLNGNLNLSLTMTFISSVLAFGMMPLWLFTLGRSLFSEIDSQLPYDNLFGALACMVIPLTIGLAFQKWLPRVAKFCCRILNPVSVGLILFIIVFGTYANLYMFHFFTWKIVLAATANVWLGFLFGTVISKAFDLALEDIIAVAVETGVQNTGVAIGLLGFSLHQPESDIASVVPVAASIMTPIPLLCAYIVIKIHHRYFPHVQESRLYVMDDEEEKKTLPTPDSSDSVLVSKIL